MEAVAFVGGAFLSSLFDWMFSKLDYFQLLNFDKPKEAPAELEEWRRLLPQIQAVLDHAEAQQIAEVSVEAWLSDLKHLAYDMEDILDQYEFQVKIGKLVADPRASTSRASKRPRRDSGPNFDVLTPKINEVTRKLQQIDRDKIVFNFQQISRQKPSSVGARTPSTSLVESYVYGRDEDREAIVELLQRDEPEVCVIPIIGMGGLGKTTLAQLVYNDPRVEETFVRRAWVCVSEEFNILKLTRLILQEMTGKSCDLNDDLNSLQKKLKNAVGEAKFLLVLDDVWNENYEEWDILRRPFLGAAAGSKIIVTSRSYNVAATMAMGCIPPYPLKTLPGDECLKLFTRHALEAENFETHPDLESIGKQIVAKCDGLPLAAKTLGGLLRSNFDLHYWEYILNCKIWDLPKERSNILPALRLSYHYLPSHLKRCFVYCAMFPKDWEFDKDQLVLLWMAEGFLKQPNGTKRMEDLYLESFDELLSRAFFQKSSPKRSSSTKRSCFVMHDLIHDLAQSIAGESCLHLPQDLEGDQLQQACFERARHFSFISRSCDTLKRFGVVKEAKRLRTFFAFARDPSWLSNKVLYEVLPNFTCLRTLSLSGYRIKKIPDAISNLAQLRYLDLSDNSFWSLPDSVTSLIFLETLILRACRLLKMLPATIGNLIELQYLDIRDTDKLENVPLETLNMKNPQIVILMDKIEGSRLVDLGSLSHLKGQLSIKNLQNIRDVQDAKEANLESIDLHELSLEWTYESGIGISNEMQVLNHLKPHNYLEILKVTGYGGSEFPPWIGNPSFSNLALLEIGGCERIRSLPPAGQLPSLKGLAIRGMKSVQRVGTEFYGVIDSCPIDNSCFPALEELEFVNMPTWEEWSCFDSTDPQSARTFPCLKSLTLQECPKLRGELPGFLPSLHKLEISDCCKAIVNCIGCLASLQTLRIHGISDLDEMVYMKDMKRLQNLYISNCPGLESLSGGKLPTMLKFLEIMDCEKLKWLPEEIMHNDGGDSESEMCFENLQIKCCPRLESFPAGKLPTTLKRIDLRGCQKLQSLPELALCESGNMLESIAIIGCRKLKILPPLRIHNLPMLKRLQMGSLGSEDAIESFIESIFLKPKMEFLNVSSSQYLKALPVLHSTTSLTRLMIQNCPMIESFPEGCFPPNLIYLHINLRDMKQPMHEWGLDRLASLKDLTIFGLCPPDGLHVSSSLTAFSMGHLEDLKSISRGLLQNFNCLQRVTISFCSNLEYLPNDLYLPPSLGSFRLQSCPLLEHKCKEEGEYWPLLSHIPCIEMFSVPRR